MAKPERRGGLGRGLGSLLPGTYDSPAPAAPAPERQRVTVEVEEEAAREAPVSTRPAAIAIEEELSGVVLSEPIPREVVSLTEVSGAADDSDRSTDEVPIEKIAPNPDQPRTQFKKEVDDNQALELALIENIQRSDLNPIEEAYGYRRLMERRSMTQAEVAQAVSKGRSTVANALRLLDLPEEAQQLLYEEKITAGHARAILSVPTAEGKAKLTEKIVEGSLTVREAENLARLLSGKRDASSSTARPSLPPVYKTVARTLRETLKTNVRVKSAKGKNKIEIEFKDEEDLQRLIHEILGSEND